MKTPKPKNALAGLIPQHEAQVPNSDSAPANPSAEPAYNAAGVPPPAVEPEPPSSAVVPDHGPVAPPSEGAKSEKPCTPSLSLSENSVSPLLADEPKTLAPAGVTQRSPAKASSADAEATSALPLTAIERKAIWAKLTMGIARETRNPTNAEKIGPWIDCLRESRAAGIGWEELVKVVAGPPINAMVKKSTLQKLVSGSAEGREGPRRTGKHQGSQDPKSHSERAGVDNITDLLSIHL